MNNQYFLKNQLKENEEELSNYLRDMNIWQDQMKRKENFPPTKKADEQKKPKLCLPSKKVANNKIPSWDYSAWDKYDVDKACEELNVENELKKNGNDNCINNLVQSKQSEGLYEKNLGNALVQKQKWAEAILRYTRAIEYDDKDPLFYANRALCYLKTKEFKLAVNDCTSSLKLDITYVKSYQRRSAAYIALEMYNEAKQDLNKVLKLEPNNKQAKIDLELLNQKIKLNNVTQKKTDNKLQKKNLQNIGSNILCKNDEQPKKSFIPLWPSRVNCNQILSKNKAPHLRSKKPFYSPKIKDVRVQKEELDNINLLKTTLKEVCEKNIKEQPKNISIKKNSAYTGKDHCVFVPPPAKTYVQFKQDWEYLQKDSKLLFQYLKQIPGNCLPSIVCNSMDHELFVDILRILKLEFVQSGCDIKNYLIGISKLPRLDMLIMFCSDIEISCITELLEYIQESDPDSTLEPFFIIIAELVKYSYTK